MIGLGTIANVAAIIVGGGIGLLLKGGLKDHYQQSLQKAMGLCTIFIGAGGALTGMLYIENGALVSINTLPMIISMVIGTLIGEYFDFGKDRCVIILPGRCESLMYSYYFAPPYEKGVF